MAGNIAPGPHDYIDIIIRLIVQKIPCSLDKSSLVGAQIGSALSRSSIAAYGIIMKVELTSLRSIVCNAK